MVPNNNNDDYLEASIQVPEVETVIDLVMSGFTYKAGGDFKPQQKLKKTVMGKRDIELVFLSYRRQ